MYCVYIYITTNGHFSTGMHIQVCMTSTINVYICVHMPNETTLGILWMSPGSFNSGRRS